MDHDAIGVIQTEIICLPPSNPNGSTIIRVLMHGVVCAFVDVPVDKVEKIRRISTI